MTLAFDPTCPRCGTHLVPLRAGDASALACPGCGGAFLDPRAVARLRTHPELVDAVVAASRAVPRDLLVFGPVTCPTCGGPLRAAVWDGVEVDGCDEHGTWFDRGEVAVVARARSHGSGVPEVIEVGAHAALLVVEHAPMIEAGGHVIGLAGTLLEAVADLLSGLG